MKKVLGVLCLLVLSFLLVSCGDEASNEQYDDIIFESQFYEYDGQAKSIYCEGVPTGYTVDYLGNGVRGVGQHVVNASILDENGNRVARKTANIYIMSLQDAEFEYSAGEEYSLECSFVPNGYEVEYIGNGVTKIGTYEVTAIVYEKAATSNDEENSEVKDETERVEVLRMTATMKVVEGEAKEEIDITGITFADLAVVFDGEEHYIECENVPDNVYVEYENNGQVEIGTYDVIAYLYDEDGNELGTLEATLTIKDPNSVDDPTIDITGITFADLTVDYDGEEHYIECENVPDNVYVEYENNGQVEIGTYDVIAYLYDEDGNELGTLEATLTIKDPNATDEPTIPGVEASEYYVEIGGNIYDLYEESINDGFTQYHATVTVKANDEVYAFNANGQITNIGDERDGAANKNNVLGNGTNMKILVGGTVDVYFKVYADGGYSIWVTGNSEEVAPEQGGNGGNNSGNVGETDYVGDPNGANYALVITHTNGSITVVYLKHVDEFDGYTQHFGDNVVLEAGDIITLRDVVNNADWVEKNIDPYGQHANFASTNEGIKCNVAGTYDFYVKFKWQNNLIYIGNENGA